MKLKPLIPTALFSLLLVACSKEIAEPQHVEEFTIQSVNAPGTYEIKVALPTNYDPENEKYSTVYVLDGDENFSFVNHHCNELSQKYSKENVLVVSIGYGRDRAMDYTPTDVVEGDGGSPEFMEFISNELIPRIESDFAADTTRNSRVILGHSFGGLFAAYAFTNHNNVFGNYIMLSPSLWYDDEILLQYEQDNRPTVSNTDQLVFLGIGELENSGRMQAPFEAFYQRLAHDYSAMKQKRNYVAQMDHVGSKKPNIIIALEFYFQNK